MAVQKPLVLINGDISQLPAGDSIEQELPVPYNVEVDFVGKDDIYKGWAVPGSVTSDPVWRISHTEFIGNDDDVTVLWADGNGNFDNIWNDHLTLTYS